MSNKTRKKKPRANEVSERREQPGTSKMVAQVTEASFSGPIPSPDLLFQYDQHLPGLADRIVTMAENEAAHRHHMESSMLAGDVSLKEKAYSERMRGQIFGFLLSVLAIAGGILLALNGVAGWGTMLSLSGVAALAGVFVLGRRLDKGK